MSAFAPLCSVRTMRAVAGFTLLEILIAVFVLALGIVGGVSMQLAAMRARHQSALSAQAAWLAAGLAERMRANSTQMALDDSANPYLTLHYDAQLQPVPVPPAVLCHSSACNAAQLAWYDLYDIQSAVREQLPAGRVLVCRDAALWSNGKLTWPCSGGSAAPIVIKVGWRGKNADGSAQADQNGQYAPGVALTVGAR